jgi:hypothetical protein
VFRLLLTWLSFAIVPDKPYPIIAVTGPARAASSSFAEFARTAIDQSEVPLVVAPTPTTWPAINSAEDLEGAFPRTWEACDAAAADQFRGTGPSAGRQTGQGILRSQPRLGRLVREHCLRLAILAGPVELIVLANLGEAPSYERCVTLGQLGRCRAALGQNAKADANYRECNTAQPRCPVPYDNAG